MCTPSQTGHISCERLSCAGSLTRLERLQAGKEDEWLPITSRRTCQQANNCTRTWMALLAAFMINIVRILHQGLGRAVGHVRIPFKVPFCSVHYYPSSEGRANNQYTGPGRGTRFGSLPIGPGMLREMLTLHILPCIHNQTLCSWSLLGGFVRTTDAPRTWLGVFAPVCRRTVWQQSPLISGAGAVLQLRRVVADRYSTFIDVELTQINFSPSSDWMTNVRWRSTPKIYIW